MEYTYIVIVEDGQVDISYVHPKSILKNKIDWDLLYGESDYVLTTPLNLFKLIRKKVKDSKNGKL